MNQLIQKDVAKLNSSATLLNFIDTSLRQIVQTESNDNQEQQNNLYSDQILKCGHTVERLPNLYNIISRFKLVKLERLHEIVVQINKFKKSKIFIIRDKHARHLLDIAMYYVSSISNSIAALFIPCILAAYLTQIGYRFSPIDMASMSPSRNILSYIIEELLVTSMLDLRRELAMGAKVFMSSDHEKRTTSSG